MTKSKNYKKTLIACYLGFITQAISANFAPLLTAVISVGLTVLLLLDLFLNSRGLRRAALVVSFAAVLLSLIPLLYGFSNYSLVGAGISLFLGAIFVGCFIRERRT